ncbi:hypothetical protein Pint_25895 [Pistacia integerrima]|uniref:Uncharacterized protein n=1 Tax=Pistacia integerrima TaxID=434235 RepID=A0ACC0YEI9_9ROSI|nr:hypothetical protein Pint_25895 [Pistacia integerrima]
MRQKGKARATRSGSRRQWTKEEDILADSLLALKKNPHWKLTTVHSKLGISWPTREDDGPMMSLRSGHPNAKGLRNKSFPRCDTLVIVFGKDRAGGAGV